MLLFANKQNFPLNNTSDMYFISATEIIQSFDEGPVVQSLVSITRLLRCQLVNTHVNLKKQMSADLTKGSFGHFSSFYVIKIIKTSKISLFCMFLQESQIASNM